MFSILSLLAIPYMTILSRMSGGGLVKLPWGLDQWLLAAPYLLFWHVLGWWVLLGYTVAVLGLRLGHGRYFNYRIPFEIGSEPEKTEILIPKSLPVYWQKFLGMCITGLAVTLILSLALCLHDSFLSGAVLMASGVAKSIAYLAPKTEWSEYLRGLALGVGVALAYFLL